MNWYEILVIVLATAFVVGVCIWQIIRKKKGKGGCDCGCTTCAHCSRCKPKGDSGESKKPE
ncbi:MAG: FeoB-associated Cys-rich membrane protein [Clostridia bacterium]|nr:FeoB-associated Cys-rich membrane protein [Clostridia bacterium]